MGNSIAFTSASAALSYSRRNNGWAAFELRPIIGDELHVLINKVFILISEKVRVSKTSICRKFTNHNRPTVHAAIDELVSCGLVVEIIEKTTKRDKRVYVINQSETIEERGEATEVHQTGEGDSDNWSCDSDFG